MGFLSVSLILSLVLSAGGGFTGVVARVIDGDTIIIRTEGKTVKRIRLAEIDAPEKRRESWGLSRDYLAKLVAGKKVWVKQLSVDKYQRIIGAVYLEGKYINAEMVRGGYAWVYRKYSKNPELLSLEKEAKGNGNGLWGDMHQDRPGKKANHK